MLSVVVANRMTEDADVDECRHALVRELREDDELVWVDRVGLDPPSVRGTLRAVTAAPRADRGSCYGLGLETASRPYVVFTDTETVLDAGWREAVATWLASGDEVVGGPVRARGPRSRRGWAGFLVDYAPHAVPPYTTRTGDVAGNNVGYRRSVLPCDRRAIWKSEVNAGLRASGIRPRLVEAMAVRATRDYRWGDLTGRRGAAGAHYARQRAATWSVPRRVLFAGGCSVLPLLALARLWQVARLSSELRRRLRASLPEVAVAIGAWSVGEAWGYLTPAKGGSHVW